MITHTQISTAKGQIHVAQTGMENPHSVLFVHGWPECWQAWQPVLEHAGSKVRAIAVDLPGVGSSEMRSPPIATDDIADCLAELAEALGLERFTIVGHDVGGMVAFSFLRKYSAMLESAVIMDTVVPGIAPWDDVLRNPYIWHFAFHAVPSLPETLVSGQERAYFDFFFNAISRHSDRLTDSIRNAHVQAYASPVALRTGFDWYRAFPRDAAANGEWAKSDAVIDTPLLYVRGSHEGGDIESYAASFRAAGLSNVQTALIADCGHFAPEEQPGAVWEAIDDFREGVRAAR